MDKENFMFKVYLDPLKSISIQDMFNDNRRMLEQSEKLKEQYEKARQDFEKYKKRVKGE